MANPGPLPHGDAAATIIGQEGTNRAASAPDVRIFHDVSPIIVLVGEIQPFGGVCGSHFMRTLL